MIIYKIGYPWFRLFGSGLLVCVLSFICFLPSTASGQLQGDKSLLELVASEWRANLGKIRTWQGKVKYTSTIRGNLPKIGHGEQETTTELEFALDISANKYMFFAIETQKTKQNDKSIPKRVAYGGIRTATCYYRVPRWTIDSGDKDSPALILDSVSDFKPSDFSPHFDPMLYFRLRVHDVYDRLMFYHKNSEWPEIKNVSVARQSNLVLFTQGTPLKTGIHKHVFDLAQGANPIEISGGKEPVIVTRKRTFEKINSIWVPKTDYVKNANSRAGRILEKSTTWVNNTVNEPIPEEVFTLNHFGLRKGTLVQDSRSGVQYKYDTASPPEELMVPKRSWVTTYLVVGLSVLVGTVLFYVWRVRRRKHQEPTHAPSV